MEAHHDTSISTRSNWIMKSIVDDEYPEQVMTTMDTNRFFLRPIVLPESLRPRKQRQDRLFGTSFTSPTQKHDPHQASHGHLSAAYILPSESDPGGLQSSRGISDAAEHSQSPSRGRVRMEKEGTACSASTQSIDYLPKPNPDPKPEPKPPKPEQPKPIPSVPILAVFQAKSYSSSVTITDQEIVWNGSGPFGHHAT